MSVPILNQHGQVKIEFNLPKLDPDLVQVANASHGEMMPMCLTVQILREIRSVQAEIGKIRQQLEGRKAQAVPAVL